MTTPNLPQSTHDAPLRLRTLGNSGLFVSELCLGTMTFGGGDDTVVVPVNASLANP